MEFHANIPSNLALKNLGAPKKIRGGHLDGVIDFWVFFHIQDQIIQAYKTVRAEGFIDWLGLSF